MSKVNLASRYMTGFFINYNGNRESVKIVHCKNPILNLELCHLNQNQINRTGSSRPGVLVLTHFTVMGLLSVTYSRDNSCHASTSSNSCFIAVLSFLGRATAIQTITTLTRELITIDIHKAFHSWL